MKRRLREFVLVLRVSGCIFVGIVRIACRVSWIWCILTLELDKRIDDFVVKPFDDEVFRLLSDERFSDFESKEKLFDRAMAFRDCGKYFSGLRCESCVSEGFDNVV